MHNILKSDNAKTYLKFVGEKFTCFDKTEYNGVIGVRENIMLMEHYYNKLKAIKFEIEKNNLISMVLESSSSYFEVMRI